MTNRLKTVQRGGSARKAAMPMVQLSGLAVPGAMVEMDAFW